MGRYGRSLTLLVAEAAMASTGGVGKWSPDAVQRGSRSCMSGHFDKVRASRRCWLTEPCEFVAAGRACNEFPGRAKSVSDPPSCGWHSSPRDPPPGDSQGTHTASPLPHLGPHVPTWGTSRRVRASPPGASRPHLGHPPGAPHTSAAADVWVRGGHAHAGHAPSCIPHQPSCRGTATHCWNII